MANTNNKKQKKSAINDGWPGMVYFVQGNKGSPVKVGYTNEGTSRSLNNRVSSLQTANPESLNVVSTIDPAYVSNEKAIHKFLEPWRIRSDGEWFEEEAVISLVGIIEHVWMEMHEPIKNKTLRNLKSVLGVNSEDDESGELIDIVLGEKMKYIDRLLSAPKLPILGWLLLQEGRDDPVGDLSRDAKNEPNRLLEVSTLLGYSSKLPWHTWGALVSAYFECYEDAKSLGHSLLLPGDTLPWEKRKNAVATL